MKGNNIVHKEDNISLNALFAMIPVENTAL